MIVDLQLSISPADAAEEQLTQAAAKALQLPKGDITDIRIVKRALDVRHKQVRLQLTLKVCTDGSIIQPPVKPFQYKDTHNCRPVIIVGAGPAGLFAALKLLENGLRPVILERGKAVEARKYDIARLSREGIVNRDSNWCFGEGGAGTYSDGKLYTRASKRGNITEVLQQLALHGAAPDILIDTHPHIGTDKLPGILARIRETITRHGGAYHFNTRVSKLILKNNTVLGVEDTQGRRYEGVAVILATGHSARDIYELFHQNRWALEAKPFALGVRVEHPQALINEIQYGAQPSRESRERGTEKGERGTGGSHMPFILAQPSRESGNMPFVPAQPSRESGIKLPPASYSLTAQVDGRGVFSFCMCPGGLMVPAVTSEGEVVLNGMSNSRRNSAYANAGIVVQVNPGELTAYQRYGALAGLQFQADVERRMVTGGRHPVAAPGQRLVDFLRGRPSSTLPASSYFPGLTPAPVDTLLPEFVRRSLAGAFIHFEKRMRGFITSEAILAAVESRTSSPVRIVRDPLTLQHPQLERLFPCGEGAGYAGGITSSAIDGINCAKKVAEIFG